MKVERPPISRCTLQQNNPMFTQPEMSEWLNDGKSKTNTKIRK